MISGDVQVRSQASFSQQGSALCKKKKLARKFTQHGGENSLRLVGFLFTQFLKCESEVAIFLHHHTTKWKKNIARKFSQSREWRVFYDSQLISKSFLLRADWTCVQVFFCTMHYLAAKLVSILRRVKIETSEKILHAPWTRKLGGRAKGQGGLVLSWEKGLPVPFNHMGCLKSTFSARNAMPQT